MALKIIGIRLKMERENDSGMNEAEYFEYLHTPEAFLKWAIEAYPAIEDEYFICVGLPEKSEIKGLS
jgi:hypothetical protein